MKALAASSIGQYEDSVRALTDYYRTVELGLGACFRAKGMEPLLPQQLERSKPNAIGAIVFGSDQGLVGQFNEDVVAFAIETLATMAGEHQVWAVGERIVAGLAEAGIQLAHLFTVPSSVQAIGPLVGQLLVETATRSNPGPTAELYLFYNGPTAAGIYAPTVQRLLPLDEAWRRTLVEAPWPTPRLPEILGGDASTLSALIREYLFISLFRACAESLASENASRLAAMQRADKNIDDLLEELHGLFHRLRQSGIDEELFDVISGVEALALGAKHSTQ